MQMPELNKKLTLYGLTMIAIGSCIGSGIFAAPSDVVQNVPHHLLVIIVWSLGGLIALTGALCFAELGSMFPKAGGVYVYLREAFGELTGFLYGWVILLVINTGALAALSIVLADFVTAFFPLEGNVLSLTLYEETFHLTRKVLFAVTVVIGLTLMNITGVRTSQIFVNLFTGLKLIAILAIIVASFIYYDPDKIILDFSTTNLPDDSFNLLMLALVGVLWSFGGWHHTSYLSGEAINAKRNVPLAMVIGVAAVTLVYILINLAYMQLMSLESISLSNKVASDAMDTLFPLGGQLVAIGITISVFGTIAIYTMSAPRIYYAMAEDGVFFKGLSRIHPKYKTPVNAMILQAVWAILLLLFWGSFGDLIKYVTFMDIIFMGLAGLSLFVLRFKKPDLERPIKVFAYPFIPAFFVIISFLFVLYVFFDDSTQEQAVAGMVVLGCGVLVYKVFQHKLGRSKKT